MTYIKINGILYPATVSGKIADKDWDSRDSKSIKIEMDYATAITLFVDGLVWSIVERTEVPVFDERGVQIGTETKGNEYDNSRFILAGDITDHRDGFITAKMGALTPLEEAYEIMFGGNA